MRFSIGVFSCLRSSNLSFVGFFAWTDADCGVWMESPLDVLSRAASMVETRDLHSNGECPFRDVAA